MVDLMVLQSVAWTAGARVDEMVAGLEFAMVAVLVGWTVGQ